MITIRETEHEADNIYMKTREIINGGRVIATISENKMRKNPQNHNEMNKDSQIY